MTEFDPEQRFPPVPGREPDDETAAPTKGPAAEPIAQEAAAPVPPVEPAAPEPIAPAQVPWDAALGIDDSTARFAAPTVRIDLPLALEATEPALSDAPPSPIPPPVVPDAGAGDVGSAEPGARVEVALGPDVRVTGRVACVLAIVSLLMVLFHLQLTSLKNANTGSRYATIESLVDYGTYNVDASQYLFTPDKVKARGHYVSSKPPVLPTYGAGIYWALKKITGYGIVPNEGIVVWTVSLFTGWLSHLVFLVYFYRLCVLLLTRQLAILVTYAAACFAYLGVAYATAINNHSTGAALAVAGFYYAYRARRRGRVADWLLAGFWLGLLPAIDLSSLALTGLTGLYLLGADWKRTLIFFVPLVIPGVLAQLVLGHTATGTFIPAYGDASLMQYPGSYFGGKRAGIDALYEPKPIYAFHVLFGHHGLFSMTPIFCFSAFEVVRRLIRRDRYFRELAVMGATTLVVSTFYIWRTHNYGGWCVGMRWLVPVMPWLLLAFGFWLDRVAFGPVKAFFVSLALAVSAFNVQDGLSSPFQYSIWHNFWDGTPNRNRLGPTWNLSRAGKPAEKEKRRSRPRKPAPRPAAPPPAPVHPPPPPHVAPPPLPLPSPPGPRQPPPALGAPVRPVAPPPPVAPRAPSSPAPAPK